MADTSNDLTILPNDPKWRRFEKLIARMYRTLAPNVRITYNDHILGRNTGQLRQIDVSLRTTIAASDILVIVQCRDYNQTLDVNDVGEFASVVEDVGAAKGAMVAARFGFTEGARNLAKAKNIDLLTLIDAENKMWAEYFGNEPAVFQQKVELPAIVTNSSLAVSFTILWRDFKPGFQIPTEFIHAKLLHADSGEAAGTLRDLVGALWRDQRISDAEGTRHYIIYLDRPVLIADDPSQSPVTKFRITAKVRQTHYYGMWKVDQMQGLHNFTDDSITTREVTTVDLDMKQVEESWQIIPSPDQAPKSAVLRLVVADYWPINDSVRLPEVREVKEVVQADLLGD